MNKILHILCLSLMVLGLTPLMANAKDWNNIIDAAGMGEVEGIKVHLNKGVSANFKDDDGETPLMSAVSMSKLDNIKFLIAQKADINARDKEGESVLVKTCWGKGNIAIAKYLISQGAVASEADVKLCRKLKRPYMANYFANNAK